MGRFSSNESYNQYCRYHSGFGGWWEIGWTFDRYYRSSRLRHPQTMSKATDEAGARRFCKKWGIKFPESETTK